MPLAFKVASEEWEFEQIHKLNYKTFVEEIPQHTPNPEKILIDKFHSENTYLICLDQEQVLGMVAVRDKRPFSLDLKLDDLESYLPLHQSICEFRLLAVDPAYRKQRVFFGLMRLLGQYTEQHGYEIGVISGAVRQLKLYKHLGFEPFGPLVGDKHAQYQPMYATFEAYEHLQKTTKTFACTPQTPVNLLPGPVAIHPEVQAAFAQPPISHRSAPFMQQFAETQRQLCELVGCRFVELFMCSGTMANDVVAGQLSLLQRPGLMLSNGEFGERLVDHATRARLSFQKVEAEWGEPFDLTMVEQTLAQNPAIGWLWVAHCETSSGLLTDIGRFQVICEEHNVRLCLDCTSSVGTVPVDLSRVYLASSVSGKGLGSYSGAAMVFYNHTLAPAPTQLPRYLDLSLYAANNGIPFTISSNLINALHAAVQRCNAERFEKIAKLSAWLRKALIVKGLSVVGSPEQTSPAVLTIALPQTICSQTVGDQLMEAGYLLSYKSRYLLERNWIQICLMGECRQEEIERLVESFEFKPDIEELRFSF